MMNDAHEVSKLKSSIHDTPGAAINLHWLGGSSSSSCNQLLHTEVGGGRCCTRDAGVLRAVWHAAPRRRLGRKQLSHAACRAAPRGAVLQPPLRLIDEVTHPPQPHRRREFGGPQQV